MSSPVSVMTAGKNSSALVFGAHSERPGSESVFFSFSALKRSLTVPLLCSVRQTRLQPKGPHQVHGRLAQRQAVQRRPQVEDIVLVAVLLVEALKDLRIQI